MNKYKAQKVVIDGEVFDSKKEARRYQELLLLQKAGKISHLERQVKYVLIPAYKEKVGKKTKTIERECAFIADFKYFDRETHEIVVEDVKGYKGGKHYDVFVIKRKLMLERYGIRVREV